MLLFIIIRILDVLKYAIFIFVMLSWFDGARNTAIYDKMEKVLNPLLEPFRSTFTFGYVDFSAVVVLITISMLQQVLLNIFL